MEDRNFETDMSIDESALDVEWLEQPKLTVKYAQLSAQAKKELDKAKMELDVTTARLDAKIRQNADSYGITKTTESAVLNTIYLQDEWKAANDKYIEARYTQSLMQDAMRAISDRTTALENLVRLFGQQYFAGPKMPRDLSAEHLKRMQSKRANAAVASEKMQRWNGDNGLK